jgi:hypothetical protein
MNLGGLSLLMCGADVRCCGVRRVQQFTFDDRACCGRQGACHLCRCQYDHQYRASRQYVNTVAGLWWQRGAHRQRSNPRTKRAAITFTADSREV